LTAASNNFGGAVSAAGTNISLTDIAGIQLGDIDDGGNLAVIAGGAVTQTAAGGAGANIDVTGTTSITAAGNAITLAAATNDFTGAVSLTNTGANDVTVTDANSLTLGTVNVGNNLNINIDAGADDTASLDLSTATITAGATITVDGQGTNDTLLGTNAANSWTITGTNAGNFNNGTETINFTDFGNITGGNNTDSFNFTTGTITNAVDGGSGAVNDTLTYAGGPAATVTLLNTGTVDGFRSSSATSLGTFDNINILTGSGGTDSLTGINAGATWTVNGGGTTYLSTNTLTFSAMENLTGGTGIDVFNVGGAYTGNLSGGDGADDFNFNAGAVTGNIDGGIGNDIFDFNGGSVTGNVDGQAGTDSLDYAGDAGAITVTITGLGATDGFAGTATRISGTFDDINTLVGSAGADTLVGANLSSNFNINGANSGTYVSTRTLTFSSVEALTGGTDTDTFTFANAGSITNAINGGTGTNTLVGDANGNVFAVTGANSGTLTGKTSGWSNIANLTGGNGVDTFAVGNTLSGLIDGGAGADTASFTAGQTVTLNGTNTGVTRVEDVNMNGAGVLVGTTGTSTWNLNAAGAGTVNDGTTTVAFSNTPTVRSGAGANVYTANGSYNGTVNLTSNNNTWNFTATQTLTTGAVTGGGALTIPGTAGADLTIGAADLVLPNVAGFAGHLIIGGALTAAGASPMTSATAITINIDTLDVATAITTGGELTLLAGDINLNADITAGGTIGMIAAGAIVNAALTGNITAAVPVTLTAPNAEFIASDNIVNSTDITLTFGGGEVDIAKGNTDDIEFAGGSTFTDTVTSPAFEAFVASTGNGSIFTTPILANVNITGLTITQAFSINPASSLIGLASLAFIDVGLFEEELTLYGQIGTGIALALAQCEAQEGCAPNVTEDEMNNLIASLEARLLELERRLAEESDPNVRAELEELIEGFNDELNDFRGYLQELKEFFAAEEEDEFEDEELDEEGSLEPDGDEVAKLARILETVKARIVWLIELKANPEERARLSKSTRIELTQEALDTIIEAAKSEAAFIENQIRLLIEGTEAMLDGVSPMFTAEVRDYNSMHTLHYGSDLLSLNGSPVKSLINVY